jgi:hypothetical protein
VAPRRRGKLVNQELTFLLSLGWTPFIAAFDGAADPSARERYADAARWRSLKARAFSMLPQVSILHQRPERFFEWS